MLLTTVVFVSGTPFIGICFHGIGRTTRKLETDEGAYWIAADQFQRILDEVATWPDVVMSFDDGNTSDVELALPALDERGLRATFFVLAGRLGQEGSLTPDDVAELTRRGMTVGSHGMDHRSWRGMDAATARTELDEAKTVIEEAAGVQIREAACPFGLYDRRAFAQLRAAGFTTVHTSDRRRARSGAWIEPRYSVGRDDSPSSLRATVFAPPGPRLKLRQQAAAVVKRWR